MAVTEESWELILDRRDGILGTVAPINQCNPPLHRASSRQ
jgi:hypothetical protein